MGAQPKARLEKSFIDFPQDFSEQGTGQEGCLVSFHSGPGFVRAALSLSKMRWKNPLRFLPDPHPAGGEISRPQFQRLLLITAGPAD